MNIRNYRMTFSRLFCALIIAAAPAASFASVTAGVSIDVAPPPLPVYVQPPCPAPGFLWMPGYWAYGPFGYYWVPGVWVRPPRIGVLWTPGYWGYEGGFYVWHAGYWARHVGFYGGVDYGFGYPGIGFVGGLWVGSVYRYNTAVVNVNRTVIHNTYIDRTVIRHTTVINRASFNGAGGIRAEPTEQERIAMHEAHFQPTVEQERHIHDAAQDRAERASYNHGKPATVAMSRVDGRRYNQQGRIASGVRSGQLSTGETHNLEHRQARIDHTIHADRQANGGSLSALQREQINRRQNHLSQSIHTDKHNATTPHYGNTEVGARRYQQQQRLANGIGNGQITPGGAARIEHQEQNINRHIAAARAAHGGQLGPRQYRRINHQQNRTSRRIYHQGHNDRHGSR